VEGEQLREGLHGRKQGERRRRRSIQACGARGSPSSAEEQLRKARKELTERYHTHKGFQNAFVEDKSDMVFPRWLGGIVSGKGLERRK
jgi:hypothetical protein